MPSSPAHSVERSSALSSRADVTAYLSGLASELGADHYLLLAIAHDRDRSDARIIASNWAYDAIQLFGFRQLASLVLSGHAAAPGQPVHAVAPANAPDLSNWLSGEAIKLLEVLGHGEIFILKLHVGRQRYFLLFSSGEVGEIDGGAVGRQHLNICYKFSGAPELLAAASLVDPLTDRERECMFWVSEGKTTDDVATILGVSANTANSYIATAIQKLGSSNRAMAMATAIRSGVI